MFFIAKSCQRPRYLVVLAVGLISLISVSEALAQGRNVTKAAKGVVGDSNFQTLKSKLEFHTNSFDSRIVNLGDDIEKLELDIQDITIDVKNIDKRVNNLDKTIKKLSRQVTKLINIYGSSSSSGGGSSSGGDSSSGGPPIIGGGRCPSGQVMVGLVQAGSQALRPQCAELDTDVGKMSCSEGQFMTGISASGDPICSEGGLATEKVFCSAKDVEAPLAQCKVGRPATLPRKPEGSVHYISSAIGSATFLCTSSGQWVQMDVSCRYWERGGSGGEGGL